MKAVSFIAQSEANECGLACLAMIAEYHGFSVDLTMLRHRFRPPTGNMTLSDLRLVASSIGLTMRALHVDVVELDKLRLPVILHLRVGHFVVMTAEARETQLINIFDPSRGPRKMDQRSFAARFTGVAAELMPALVE